MAVQEKEKLFTHPWIAEKYYDYPDGEDLVGKLKFTTKIGALAGSFLGSVKTFPQREEILTFPTKFIRFSRAFFPCVGMAATFTCVTYYSTVLRKKDDEINHFFGGFAAGALMGPAIGSFVVGAWMAVICGTSAFFIKNARVNNLEVMSTKPEREMVPPYFYRKMDFTMMPDIKGNWTK